MQNKDKFIKAMDTLLFSWGGDTPAEAVWGINELLEFYEAETGHKLGLRYCELDQPEEVINGFQYVNEFDKIAKAIMEDDGL